MRLAEHFRSAVLPQQGEQWRESLPRVPLTTEELKVVLRLREDEDERRAITELAKKGSTSAVIMDFLELTREIVREALEILRGERRLQVNLARILGAVRFKVLTQGKVYHVKCPKKHCFEKDSFQHMLRCYHLEDVVTIGVEAVPFLVKMARVTALPEGTRLIPYMVEYNEGRGIAQEEEEEETGLAETAINRTGEGEEE